MSRPPGRPGLYCRYRLGETLAQADSPDSLDFLAFERRGLHLIGAPIFQAAGLNMGNGMLVVSDGLFDSGFSSW